MADKWIQLMSEDGTDNLFPTSKIDLLWENASPMSAFAAQTVSLDLSGYKTVCIVTNNNYSGDPDGYTYLPVGSSSIVTNMNKGGTYRLRRRACIVSSTGVTFEDARDTAGWDNNSQSNGTAIPQKIYGIK